MAVRLGFEIYQLASFLESLNSSKVPTELSASNSRCGVAQNPPNLPMIESLEVGQGYTRADCVESQAPPLEAAAQRGQFETFAE